MYTYRQEREQLNPGGTGGANSALKVATNCHWWRIDLFVNLQQNNQVGIYIDGVYVGVEPVNLSGGGTTVFYSGYASYCCAVKRPDVFYSNKLMIRNGATFDVINSDIEISNTTACSLSITRGWFSAKK